MPVPEYICTCSFLFCFCFTVSFSFVSFVSFVSISIVYCDRIGYAIGPQESGGSCAVRAIISLRLRYTLHIKINWLQTKRKTRKYTQNPNYFGNDNMILLKSPHLSQRFSQLPLR